MDNLTALFKKINIGSRAKKATKKNKNRAPASIKTKGMGIKTVNVRTGIKRNNTRRKKLEEKVKERKRKEEEQQELERAKFLKRSEAAKRIAVLKKLKVATEAAMEAAKAKAKAKLAEEVARTATKIVNTTVISATKAKAMEESINKSIGKNDLRNVKNLEKLARNQQKEIDELENIFGKFRM